MNLKPQLPAHPVRSKGQATVQPDGEDAFPATIRDISPSGIGVLASQAVGPGTFVRIDIHGHAAHGVVNRCADEGPHFYIGVTLDQSALPETPAA